MIRFRLGEKRRHWRTLRAVERPEKAAFGAECRTTCAVAAISDRQL